MRCDLTCTEPDDIEYTIKITATVGEWREMRGQFTDNQLNMPYSLQREISSMLSQANRTFKPEESIDLQNTTK